MRFTPVSVALLALAHALGAHAAPAVDRTASLAARQLPSDIIGNLVDQILGGILSQGLIQQIVKELEGATSELHPRAPSSSDATSSSANVGSTASTASKPPSNPQGTPKAPPTLPQPTSLLAPVASAKPSRVGLPSALQPVQSVLSGPTGKLASA